MSGTKNLDPTPLELAPTEALSGRDVDDEVRARAKAMGVLPAVLEADQKARDSSRKPMAVYDGSEPFQRYGVIPPLTTDPRRLARVLWLFDKLLADQPFSAERVELEVLLRGGNLGPAPERVISPKAETIEAK